MKKANLFLYINSHYCSLLATLNLFQSKLLCFGGDSEQNEN